MTYTYVTMEVSAAVYAEIRTKLVDAGYANALHTITGNGEELGEELDMHGIALVAEPQSGEKP